MAGVLVIIVMLALSNAASAGTFAGGTGEPNDPYQIATAAQLLAIGSDTKLLDKCYVLVADLDLHPNLPGGQVFSQSPIAPQLRASHGPFYGYFSGVFDGDGHVIRNMVIHTEKGAAAGLFGYVDRPGRIMNLGLEGVDIQRTMTDQREFAGGGLVAVNMGGAILACYTTGAVVEDNQLPDSIWQRDDSDYDRVGGLIGENRGLVHACYAIVHVRGSDTVGGLIGLNEGAAWFSFSAGDVEGTGNVGGLVGRSDTGTTFRCYWDAKRTGNRKDGGKTPAEMMSRETYESWRYTGAWTLDDTNDYPHLAWEQAAGAPIADENAGYDAGSGEPNDPIQIRTAAQFVTLGHRPEDFDKSFVLTADIDFNNVDCNDIRPIGCPYLPLGGSFDGKSHVLSNLTISLPDETCVGVFGVVGAPEVFPRDHELDYHTGESMYDFGWGMSGSIASNSKLTSTCMITDLHLRDVTIAGREYVGGLVGLGQATIADCSISGHVTGLSVIGGLIGRSVNSSIASCVADVNVGGEFDVGGLAGALFWAHSATLFDCHVTGKVSGLLNAGGLVGYSTAGTINQCSVQADVTGKFNTGGCLGYASATVIASWFRGTVSSKWFVGGFIGWVGGATISDCYCQGAVAGEAPVGGFSGYCGSEHIARCYAAASITASATAVELLYPTLGAFVGHAAFRKDKCPEPCPVDISDCFWDADLCAITQAIGNRPAGFGDIHGLPTTQMQTASAFRAAGWDMDAMWTICEGEDYPRLRWEQVACDK